MKLIKIEKTDRGIFGQFITAIVRSGKKEFYLVYRSAQKRRFVSGGDREYWKRATDETWSVQDRVDRKLAQSLTEFMLSNEQAIEFIRRNHGKISNN